MENPSGVPKIFPRPKEIPFILRLILYQNAFHFMPLLFMFIKSPAFLRNPHWKPMVRFVRTVEIMESKLVGGHLCVRITEAHWHRYSYLPTAKKQKHVRNSHTLHNNEREVEKQYQNAPLLPIGTAQTLIFSTHYCFLSKNYLQFNSLNSVKNKSNRNNEFKGRIPLSSSVVFMGTGQKCFVHLWGLLSVKYLPSLAEMKGLGTTSTLCPSLS